MLLSREERDRVARDGKARLLRRWRRPTVTAGGTLRTAIGVLAIEGVRRVAPEAITDADARAVGFRSASDLRSALTHDANTALYRIDLRYQGPDPRDELRHDTSLDVSALADLVARLDRFDARTPWSRAVLSLIGSHPGRRAADLAATLGTDTEMFKRNVRKLKELGLTESLDVGYRLSPRGQALMAMLTAVPQARDG